MASPEILRLQLQGFRGFESLIWRPTPGMNVILGGGNVGKTTLLDAIALLLHPTNGYTVTDSDYWQRKVDEEFCIEAVMVLPDHTGINRQRQPAWPWEWDGKDAVQPKTEGEGGARQPVYKVRVRGTTDLELVHEHVFPDGSTAGFNTALRRGIGLVRLTGDDRNDRDLRLVQGGSLDRLLADKSLKAKLGRKVALESYEDQLGDDAQGRLGSLDTLFRERALPNGLGLGFIGGVGISINSLVGLTAKKDGVPLPITSWGAGTRRLASLAIADALQDGFPITVVDELERGLEPYRQRRLVQALGGNGAQIFITTHSATVISESAGAALWYVDSASNVGWLPALKVGAHQSKDPETFLARLSVVAEGDTEVGFINRLLTQFIGESWKDEGIHVTAAGGNEAVLKLLEALSSVGLRFAGFADHEAASPNPGRWAQVKTRLGALLFRWDNGSLEENILPLFEVGDLQGLIEDPGGRRTGERLRTLATRLCIQERTFEAILAAAGDSINTLIVQAATGFVPDAIRADANTTKVYKAHSTHWFKSVEGGEELATKVLNTGVWPVIRSSLIPFLNAIREALEMPLLPPDLHE